ncbi:hypothetical protein TNCT_56051 [Trichonephila clavata]|uniref:Uncharacterized protein n=1 Tax=Trichonephila clavata TaxID=2740835 RepID=A0A8X6FIH3_TRICU|nr:hypothetical protein TNCT_56051 [Trichonephila clavata]
MVRTRHNETFFSDRDVPGTKADPLCDRGVSPGAQRSRQTLGLRPRASERETTLFSSNDSSQGSIPLLGMNCVKNCSIV